MMFYYETWYIIPVWLTNWSIYLTQAYLIMSILANIFPGTLLEFLSFKAIAILLGELTINIDFIVTVVTWILIIPGGISSAWGT